MEWAKRCLFTLFHIVCGSILDYGTWHSPLVFSGTCKNTDLSGQCSEINVWYVYKGNDHLTSNVMHSESDKGFDTTVIHSIEGQGRTVKQHQTRVFYAIVSDDRVLLMSEPSNVFLKNLERVAKLVKWQQVNPHATPADASRAGFDIGNRDTLEPIVTPPMCSYDTWSSWQSCDCTKEVKIRRRRLERFPQDDERCDQYRYEERDCVEECEGSADRTTSDDEDEEPNLSYEPYDRPSQSSNEIIDELEVEEIYVSENTQY